MTWHLEAGELSDLADALVRHLEQYPSTANGLSRSQNQIMAAVSAGASKLTQIFAAATTEMEEQPFMGDTSLFLLIDGLATCPVPLLKLDGPGSLKDAMDLPGVADTPSLKGSSRWDVSITDAGRAVLAGEEDFVALNGIDRWLGGVHLRGGDARWRWDDERRRIVDGV